jgi:hypothetical protein
MNSIQKTVTQTVAMAAAKTFLQAFLAILALLAVPVLTSWAGTIQDGGSIEVDLRFWTQVLVAALGAGIAALISAAWNWSKTP